MAVFDQTDKQKIYLSTLLTTLLLAATVFSALLIARAGQLSSGVGIVTGSIGPMRLFEITKTALSSGGYSGGFRLLTPGLLMYGAVWLGLGLVVAFLRGRKG